MQKPSVLIAGPAIALDENLRKELQNEVKILTSSDTEQVGSILESNKIDILILEISDGADAIYVYVVVCCIRL